MRLGRRCGPGGAPAAAPAAPKEAAAKPKKEDAAAATRRRRPVPRCFPSAVDSKYAKETGREGAAAYLRGPMEGQQGHQRHRRPEVDPEGRRLLERVQQEAEGLNCRTTARIAFRAARVSGSRQENASKRDGLFCRTAFRRAADADLHCSFHAVSVGIWRKSFQESPACQQGYERNDLRDAGRAGTGVGSAGRIFARAGRWRRIDPRGAADGLCGRRAQSPCGDRHQRHRGGRQCRRSICRTMRAAAPSYGRAR